MKIAFFGTSDRSLAILNALTREFQLVLCVTKPDAIVGRKHESKKTEVKKWAKNKNIEVFETNSLKTDSEDLTEKLRLLSVELGIVADFSLFVPEKVISTFKYGMINVHFSLLPKLRGASPVQFTILNGDAKTGITYFLLAKGMDDGKILSQIEYPVTGHETSDTLYCELFQLAADNLPSVIKSYSEGKITLIEQKQNEATYTYSRSHPKNTFIYKEDALIDWGNNDEYIEKQVRAYNPWPIAWTTLEAFEKARVFAKEGLSIKNRTNLALKLKIYEAVLKDETLYPTLVQPENGKKLLWEDFINGYLVKTN